MVEVGARCAVAPCRRRRTDISSREAARREGFSLIRRLAICLIAIVLGASCATAPVAMPPAVTPQGEDRFLIDPRVGNPAPTDPETDQRFEAAWRYFLAG